MEPTGATAQVINDTGTVQTVRTYIPAGERPSPIYAAASE